MGLNGTVFPVSRKKICVYLTIHSLFQWTTFYPLENPFWILHPQWIHSIQQIWKTQQWPQGWKRSIFIPIPKKCNAKECSNYHTVALFSHTSNIMLKFLQARFQQYMNQKLPDVQAGFRKGRGIMDQIANTHWVIEKAWEFQKKKQMLLFYWLCILVQGDGKTHAEKEQSQGLPW